MWDVLRAFYSRATQVGWEEVEVSGAEAGTAQKRGVRMVVGVTSPQTCLVLSGRLRALREAGFEVTVVSSPGELLQRTVEADGVDACSIPLRRGLAPVADLGAFLGILWFLLRRRPRIVEFSTPKAGLLGSVAACCLCIPQRVYMLRGLKLESASGWKRRVLVGAERMAARCAHVVLCNSESLRQEALALGVAPARKLVVLGDGSSNGVDMERFRPEGASAMRARLDLPDGEPVLGFVGRLTGDKGIPELLDAFDLVLERYPRCWLLLVGWFDAAEDELSQELQARVADHPRIRHTGFVADTAGYYRVMDVLLLPTHREGFPNVALEASATGIPVITTEATGARDAVLAEVTGLLVPPGYPEALAEAAVGLLGDEAKRKRMGTAARAWVGERYSQERVLRLTTEFYRRRVFGQAGV